MELLELKEIYEAYKKALGQTFKEASPLAGLFGLGSSGDPRYAPCNQEFYNQVGEWIDRFIADQPEEKAVYEVCCFIFEAAENNKKARSYWYYLICHGYVSKMLPLLSRESCASLRDWYRKTYPKHKRLPFQDQLYKQLGDAAK